MEANKHKIDKLDRAILSFLIKDARMSFLEIARSCGVSGAAIHQRVRKLEEDGIISGYSLIVKPSAVGLNVCAFVGIKLSENNKYPEVIAALKKIPEIVECHFVTGSSALLIKLYCTTYDHFMEIILNTIQRIPYIQSTDTMISVDNAFDRPVWVGQETDKEITWRKSIE